MKDLQPELERIERAVDVGKTDLGSLGFWSLVRRVKADPAMVSRWADDVARIDRKAFEARKRVRVPVWAGNTILLSGTVVLAALVAVALRLAEGIDVPRPGLGGVLLLVAAGGLAVTVHGPAHWLAGRLGGMRFVAYFLGGPFRIQPGIKVDYATYLRAAPAARATMHAAGALATKAAPFAVLIVALVRHLQADVPLLPLWALWGVAGMGLLQIVTDVVWSTKRSDWKKVRREAAFSRSQEA